MIEKQNKKKPKHAKEGKKKTTLTENKKNE